MWRHFPILVYATIREAVKHHPDADVVVNFASFRSAFEVSMESIKYPNIRTVAIIAEGIPENQTRELIIAAKEKNVTIIGENFNDTKSSPDTAGILNVTKLYLWLRKVAFIQYFKNRF